VRTVPRPTERDLARQLDEELLQTRRRLRETIESAERSDGELRARGEELETMIEELRASAEEMAHGRQQLESINLELMTVNRELRLKIDETAKAHDDLSNLVASSDVATLFLDRDMRILRYTPRIADIFNLIPADVGRPLTHITCKLDDPGLADEAARVFETLQPMEREVRGRNGRYYVARMLPYRTRQERIEGAVMSFFDISDRRAAEEALRRSEERHRAELERQVRERTAQLKAKHDLLQATMDASVDLIEVFEAVRDEAGAIVDFRWILNNHAAQLQYGDVSGANLLRSNPGAVEQGIFDAFRRVVETGEPDQAERHHVDEQFDGWFLQTVVKLGDGVATTTKDISAWRRAQREVLRLLDEAAQAGLRESKQRFGALVGEFAQAVWETDADGRVKSDSPSWRAYTGQTLRQWLDAGWTGALHPDDRAGALRQWQDAIAARRVFDAEFRLRRAAGGWRRARVRAAPLFDADGALEKWVGMNVDVEGRRDA
jgi:PAS domain S-box-containing protein